MSNFLYKPIPLKAWFQPLSLFVTTVLLVAVVFWFGLALVEIQPNRPSIALRTAGWFYLGIPCILGIGLTGGLVTTFVARKIGQIPVWVVIVPLSMFLAYDGGTRDFPERRLSVILGIDAQSTQVIDYRVFDSFGDGNMTIGALQPVSSDVFESILTVRQLSTEETTSRPTLHEDKYPTGLPTASDRRLTVWHDANEQRLYFRYHS